MVTEVSTANKLNGAALTAPHARNGNVNGNGNGKHPAAQPLTASAIRFRQKRQDVTLYVTTSVSATPRRIASDTYATDNPGLPAPRRQSRLPGVEYVRSEEGLLPASILLAFASPTLRLIPAGKAGGARPAR
jgi:hypothetical protein